MLTSVFTRKMEQLIMLTVRTLALMGRCKQVKRFKLLFRIERWDRCNEQVSSQFGSVENSILTSFSSLLKYPISSPRS